MRAEFFIEWLGTGVPRVRLQKNQGKSHGIVYSLNSGCLFVDFNWSCEHHCRWSLVVVFPAPCLIKL